MLFDGDADGIAVLLLVDRERLALQARRGIVRLDGSDGPACDLLCGEAVEQHADVRDVIHVPAKVNVRRTDGVIPGKIRVCKIVAEPRGRVRDPFFARERELPRDCLLYTSDAADE